MLNKFVINNHFFFKKFYVPSCLKIEYIILKTQKFLFITSSFNSKIYFLMPPLLYFFFSKNILYFSSTNCNYHSFFLFFFNLKFYLKQIKTIFFKTIFIRGTSYRINFLENTNNVLKLKLGYSHLIYLVVPNTIFIKLFKRKLVLKCFNNVLLGNFSSLLCNYRPINIFTGKGLLIKKRKKFKLKEYSKKI